MGRVTVRPFEPADLGACAAIFAGRQKLARERLRMLAAGITEPAGAEALLAPGAANPRMRRVVAERDGRVAGFLFGEEMLFPPDHFASQYIPPMSFGMGVDGHAVAPGEAVTEVYRAMYVELARDAVQRGLFIQRVNIVPDPEVEEAWVSLGFGRRLVAATRPVADAVPALSAPGIEVHQASAEDIDVVMGLAHALNRHHLQSPIFWPILPAPQPAAREYNLGHLADPEANPYFVAYRDGRPIAMQSFNQPGFTPPVVEKDGNIYLYEGIVEEDARTGGVGAALLAHTMAWLRERGMTWCTLHFASMNPHGGPFWLKHGFVPVEYEMERVVDERVAWARG